MSETHDWWSEVVFFPIFFIKFNEKEKVNFVLWDTANIKHQHSGEAGLIKL